MFVFRSLCDTNQAGKLTEEQFALAMWLIEQKLAGKEPPQTLTPEMVPPSQRTDKEVQVINLIYIPFFNFILLIVCNLKSFNLYSVWIIS